MSKRFSEVQIGAEVVVAWQSTAEHDNEWNAFVEKLPQGRHEQTSMWAGTKRLSGWHSLRLLLTANGTLVGGGQILYKQMRYIGKISYIINGPLLETDDPELRSFAIDALKQLAVRQGLRALLVQPAPSSEELLKNMEEAKFLPNDNHLYEMIKGTTILDLSPDEETILTNMRPHRRRNLRRNARRGAEIGLEFVEGSEADLQIAFELMCQTCERRGVAANPGSVESLRHMWKLYHPKGKLRLFFMVKDGEKTCMGIMIGHGAGALIWKIGWNGSFSKYSPNDLLHWECIKWAKAAGYKHFDFDGLDPQLAEQILSSKSVSDELMKSTAFYKLGYGGDLIRYQEAQVYFANPILRWGFMSYGMFVKAYRTRKAIPHPIK